MTSKVIAVTGASGGIGLAVAQKLVQDAHKVVLVARRHEALDTLKRLHPTQVEWIAGDLADANVAAAVVETAVQKFGRLDGLVVNHGTLSPMARLEDADIADWVRSYQTNLFSAVALAKHAIPELRKTRGCVVWVSSGAATRPYVSWGAYGSSKAALHSVATHLAAEESDICSISFLPGRVDTDMQRELREHGQASMRADEYDSFAGAYADGTLHEPDAVGAVIARLAARPKASFGGQVLKYGSPELSEYRE